METRLIEQLFGKRGMCGCCLKDLWIGFSWLPEWSVISSRIALMNLEDKKNLYYEVLCELTRLRSIKTFSIEQTGIPILMGVFTTVVAFFTSLQGVAVSSAKVAGDAWDTLSGVLTNTFSPLIGYILAFLVLLLAVNFFLSNVGVKELLAIQWRLKFLKKI